MTLTNAIADAKGIAQATGATVYIMKMDNTAKGYLWAKVMPLDGECVRVITPTRPASAIECPASI